MRMVLTFEVIYLVLTFGFAGAPGHFGMFGLAAKVATQAHATAAHRDGGPPPFKHFGHCFLRPAQEASIHTCIWKTCKKERSAEPLGMTP